MNSFFFAATNQMATDFAAYYQILTTGLNFRTIPRGYYLEIRDIMTNRKRMRPQRIFDISIYIFFSFRLTLHLIIFNSNLGDYLPLWKVDFLYAFGYYYPNDYNGVLCFIVLNIVIFGTIAQYMLYFSSVETLAWKLYYDIVVRNTENYLECYRNEIDVVSCRKLLEKNEQAMFDRGCGLFYHLLPRKLVFLYIHCKSLVKSWGKMKHIDLELLSKRRLHYVHDLSISCRCWLYGFLDLLELIFLIQPLIFRIFTAAYFASYSFKFVEHFPTWAWPEIAFEVVVINYLVIIFVRIAHVCSYNVVIASFIYCLYVHQLYKGLGRILRKYRSVVCEDVKSVQIVIQKDIEKLTIFLAEHTRICYYLMQSNRDLWGRFLFAFVPIQLLTMIFLSFYLLVEDVPLESRTTFTTILYFYVFVMFVIMLPLSYISKVIHACSPEVYKVQGMLPKSRLGAKIKYMTFYERLASENVIYGLSVGPIRTITFTIVGQVSVFKV